MSISYKERIERLEKRAEDVRVWQATYGEKITGIEREMSRLVKLVEGLTDKPQKRWDTLVAALIASAVSLAFGLLLK